MIFGAILAGGVGSRMKIADRPKQFCLWVKNLFSFTHLKNSCCAAVLRRFI